MELSINKVVHLSMKNSNYCVYVVVLFLSFSFGCGSEEVFNEIGNYKDGKKDGKWISYCKHDQKVEEGNYKDGEKHGKWNFYFEDGQIWYEGNYQDGKEHGEFIYSGYGNYNILHKVKSENYIDGKLDGKSIHYHVNGEIGRTENFKDGARNGNDIFYDKDGEIFWSGKYKDGILIDGDFIKSDKPFNLH